MKCGINEAKQALSNGFHQQNKGTNNNCLTVRDVWKADILFIDKYLNYTDMLNWGLKTWLEIMSIFLFK